MRFYGRGAAWEMVYAVAWPDPFLHDDMQKRAKRIFESYQKCPAAEPRNLTSLLEIVDHG